MDERTKSRFNAKIELVTFVALVDLAVQQQTIDKAKTNIISKIQSETPTTQIEFLKIVVTERGAKADERYRADAISRRRGDNKQTKNRNNT